MENQNAKLSDRSILIMTPPKGVMWVGLPVKRMQPLTKKILRLYPPRPLKGIQHCVTWTPIFANMPLEAAAVLWIHETLRQIGIDKKPMAENVPMVKAVIDLSSMLFTLRERELAKGPHGVRHIRQAMYWVENHNDTGSKGEIKIGYNIGRGFYMDNKHNAALEPLATYCIRVNDGPVIGTWRDMPVELAAPPPTAPAGPRPLDTVDTRVRH